MLYIQAVASVFELSTTPFIVVSNLSSPIILYVNDAFCSWLGYEREELLNAELFSSSGKLLHALALDKAELLYLFGEAAAMKAAVKGTNKVSEPKTKTSSDKEHTCDYEIFPILETDSVTMLAMQVNIKQGEVLGSTKDDAPALTANQSLEILIDSITNVIFTLDVESLGVYRFSFVNRAFQDTTGLAITEVIGKYVHEIIPEPSLTLVLGKYKEAIEEGKPISWEEVTEYPTGQKIGEVMIFPVLDADGHYYRLAGLVHDITPYREAETKQTRLAQDLYRQNRDLQQFTYIISHNLRAPLTNALGLVRLLPDVSPESDLFLQYVSYIKTSIENLDKILVDLNMILSIRDRQDLAQLEPVSLREVCKQAADALEVELSQAKGKIDVNIEPEFKVQANRVYIYSICYNLLSNSIKFRSLERPLHIQVTSESEGEVGPAVHFTDNGSGMDLAKVGHDLFKLYKRFHHNVNGRGIGLYLVKTHLDALGGRIEVKSEPNTGTTFSIFFKELVS